VYGYHERLALFTYFFQGLEELRQQVEYSSKAPRKDSRLLWNLNVVVVDELFQNRQCLSCGGSL